MSDIVGRLRSTQNPGLAVRQEAADEIERLNAQTLELVRENERLRNRLRDAYAPVRQLLWCLTVWNDHNFSERDLVRKVVEARVALGLTGVDRVDVANELLRRIDQLVNHP